jgi:hypothetical protein
VKQVFTTTTQICDLMFIQYKLEKTWRDISQWPLYISGARKWVPRLSKSVKYIYFKYNLFRTWIAQLTTNKALSMTSKESLLIPSEKCSLRILYHSVRGRLVNAGIHPAGVSLLTIKTRSALCRNDYV